MMIRKAKIKDIPDVSRLLEQVLQLHYNGRPDIFKSGTKKYTEAELQSIFFNEKTPVFVFENDARVQGYAFCIIKDCPNDNILRDRKTLYIDDLCVEETQRGKGIGKQLFEYVKNFAKEIGCYNLTLNVWQCNTSALKFYEKMGLIPQKTILETLL